MYVPNNYSKEQVDPRTTFVGTADVSGTQRGSSYTWDDHRSSYQALRRNGSYVREAKNDDDTSNATTWIRITRLFTRCRERAQNGYYFVREQLVDVSWQELSLIVLTVFMLMLGTATERVTFKMMVDRMLPYKFVLLQIIYLLSSIAFGLVAFSKARFMRNIDSTSEMRDFPMIDIVIMAVIDTVPFIIMIYTASQVYATLTVILMHTSTIFVVLGSKLTFPHRIYTKMNLAGVVLIAVAVVICLVKVILEQLYIRWELSAAGEPTFSHHHVILDTFLYTAAAAMHGLGTVFKEKSIIRWSQPIDNFFLSSWLFFYQFLIMVAFTVLYCLVRAAVGYIDLQEAFSNIYFGWLCFLGQESPDRYDDDDSNFIDCSQSMGLVFGFVLANIVVMISMSGVLRMKSHILGRVTAFAILAAFIVLWWYDVAVTESTWFGSREGVMDIAGIVVLLVGMEVYDRDPEPDVELISNQQTLSVSYQNFPPDSVGPGISIA